MFAILCCFCCCSSLFFIFRFFGCRPHSTRRTTHTHSTHQFRYKAKWMNNSVDYLRAHELAELLFGHCLQLNERTILKCRLYTFTNSFLSECQVKEALLYLFLYTTARHTYSQWYMGLLVKLQLHTASNLLFAICIVCVCARLQHILYCETIAL